MPNFNQQELEVLEFTHNLINSEKFDDYRHRKYSYIFNYLWDTDFENDEHFAEDIMHTYVILEPTILDIIHSKYMQCKRIGVHTEHCINMIENFHEKRSHFISMHNYISRLTRAFPEIECEVLDIYPDFSNTLDNMSGVWNLKIAILRDEEVSRCYYQMVECDKLFRKYHKIFSNEQDTHDPNTQEGTPEWYTQVEDAQESISDAQEVIEDTQEVNEEPITQEVIEDTQEVIEDTQEVNEEPIVQEVSEDTQDVIEDTQEVIDDTQEVEESHNTEEVEETYTLEEVIESIESNDADEEPNRMELSDVSEENTPKVADSEEPNMTPSAQTVSTSDPEISNNLIL